MQDRHHQGREIVLRLGRQGGRDRAVVVAHQREDPAVQRGAGGARVAHRVHRPVEPRPLAVPDREHPVIAPALEQVDLLRAPDRGRRQVLVEAGLEMDAVLLEEAAGAPERGVVTGERRAPVARDEPGRVQPRRGVALPLHQREPHQRLGAGQVHPAGFERVLVVERDLRQFHEALPERRFRPALRSCR